MENQILRSNLCLTRSLLTSVTVENIDQKAWYRWHTPVVLAPGRLRQGFLRLKSSLGFRDTISKREKKYY